MSKSPARHQPSPRPGRLLADASFEKTKEQLIAVERNELLAEKIYQSISAEADRHRISRAVFAEDFWHKVSQVAGVEIVDKRFRMPMLKEHQ